MQTIKKIIGIIIIILIIICYISIPYIIDCCSSKPSRDYNEEEIEDIVNDPQWNVPSRYR